MVLRIASQISSTTPQDDPFDQLLGHFGRWQLLIFGAVSLVKLSSGWVQMAILFLTPNLTFRCSNMTLYLGNDLMMNSTFSTADDEMTNSSLADSMVNNSSFTDSIFDTSGGIYVEAVNNTCYSDCKKYEYDATPFDNTIVSEWDLVCERQWLASFTQMVLQLGILIGSIVFGFLSDRFGRKNTFLFAITCLVTFGFGVPFSPNYPVFTMVRFLLGMATAGTMVVSFVIVMEAVGAKYRAVVGCLFQIPFIIGHMTIPLIAYFYRSWDAYSLAMAIPPLIYLGYFFILTESPRWLLSVGRVSEAAEIVKKAALFNRRPTGKIEETLRALSAQQTASTPAPMPNYSALFRGSLCTTTVACCIVWLTSGFTFFGVNQYISQTSPDPFVSVATAGAVQIPSNLLAMWLISQFGRKATTVSFLALGGLCIILLGCVPEIFALTLVLGTLGVSCASIVAITIYIYTSELYPTVVRNMGMGASSTSMRVGSMLAPFISNLSVTVPWLPTVIFGLAPIGAALVCLCLPETKGRTLPDSLEDVRNENS